MAPPLFQTEADMGRSRAVSLAQHGEHSALAAQGFGLPWARPHAHRLTQNVLSLSDVKGAPDRTGCPLIEANREQTNRAFNAVGEGECIA
jgi:hypothetical protein